MKRRGKKREIKKMPDPDVALVSHCGKSKPLICPCKDHPALGAGAALDALAFFRRGITWNIANGCLGFVFDLLLAFSGAAPVGPDETAAIQEFAELGVIIDVISVLIAEFKSTVIQ